MTATRPGRDGIVAEGLCDAFGSLKVLALDSISHKSPGAQTASGQASGSESEAEIDTTPTARICIPAMLRVRSAGLDMAKYLFPNRATEQILENKRRRGTNKSYTPVHTNTPPGLAPAFNYQAGRGEIKTLTHQVGKGERGSQALPEALHVHAHMHAAAHTLSLGSQAGDRPRCAENVKT
ncbi:hypothetical protein KUCAC02_032647 [Chaenocephalus aceratus]|nr:hypothetical protein KUCAC02_032647 [Chaenocephalus aceratus]